MRSDFLSSSNIYNIISLYGAQEVTERAREKESEKKRDLKIEIHESGASIIII